MPHSTHIKNRKVLTAMTKSLEYMISDWFPQIELLPFIAIEFRAASSTALDALMPNCSTLTLEQAIFRQKIASMSTPSIFDRTKSSDDTFKNANWFSPGKKNKWLSITSSITDAFFLLLCCSFVPLSGKYFSNLRVSVGPHHTLPSTNSCYVILKCS